MPRPRYRSRTFRRVKVRTPGAQTKTYYKRRNPSHAKCGKCGYELKAVPRVLPYKMKALPKTKKRPERPYGGVLCSGCMRKKLIMDVRK